MIRVEITPEPANFHERCRLRGQHWLAANARPPSSQSWRPRNFWKEFLPDLELAFHHRCAYLAMWIHSGSVDHFHSWAGHGGEAKAYEWSNFRYAATEMNSAKKPSWGGYLIDPFEVDDDWFEVLLPSCLLRIVESQVPPDLLPRVRFTVEKFGLDQREDIVALRREWLRMHESEGLSLEGLRRKAPLLARAVEARNRVGH